MLSGFFPIIGAAADSDQGSDWLGKWIWTSDSPSEGQWVNLRKKFSLNEVPSSAKARISVDSRYWMWINGTLVVYEGQLKSGPSVSSWYYDVVELAPYLRVGENTIAVLACYWGHNSASAVATGNQAFLFDAEFPSGSLDGSTRLISDASWKAIKNPAYEVPPARKNKRPDAVDTQFNAGKAIEGWQEPDFDDSAWANATVKKLSASDPRQTLAERSIPQWKVDDIVKYGPDEWTVTEENPGVFAPLSLPRKYTVTAVLKSLNNTPIGMVVCMGDATHFYMPQVQKSGGEVKIKPHLNNGGKWSYPALQGEAAAAAALSEPITLTIEVNETDVTTYINGTKVGSFTDATLARSGSSIGFRSSTGEQTAVYSMKVTGADGGLLWEAPLSEAHANGEITSFQKLSGNSDPVLKEDELGKTYLLVQGCVVTAGTTQSSGSGSRVYSFHNPTNMQGTPYLKVRSEKGGETIKLSSDSTAHDGGESVLHWYVTKAGEQEWEAYNWMSAWRVDFTVPSTVEVLELGWRKSSYNTEHTGSVTTDNEAMNQLYREAYDTLLITMRDIYMDCPDRERTQWWGDAVLEMQQAAYAMDENARLLYKKLLTQVIGWSRDRGGPMPATPTNPTYMELPAQCLAGIHSLWQFYLYYGETDILETCYNGFMDYLKLWQLNERGALTHRNATTDWLDWGTHVDAAVLEYTWYYAATESMRNVARVLGKSQADIDYLQRGMDLMESHFESLFWNERLHGYYSQTTNGLPDDRAQAMAIYTGLADPAHNPELLRIFLTTENASPYMEKYVLEAMYLAGYAEEAVARTVKRYDVMLKDDHPTLYETWTESQLSGNGGTNTRNHAWSGGPLSLMYMYHAGIIPTGAAFETFRVRPALGSLTQVSAATNTPKGTISVEVAPNALTVTVPSGSISAEICVPRIGGRATAVRLGGAVVYRNGSPVQDLPAGVTYSGEDTGYVCFTVLPGTYAFSTEEDAASASDTHTVTVTSRGNGTVTVNGTPVRGSATVSVSGKVTLAATPAAGSRVACLTGAIAETLYSEQAVERSFTPNGDVTLNVVFDKPSVDKPLLLIVDDSKDPLAPASRQAMYYAFRVFVNGEELRLYRYIRNATYPLPSHIVAERGERIAVSVEPVDPTNYEVWLTDESGRRLTETTVTMDSDVTLRIGVREKDAVNKIPIRNVESNSYYNSTAWKPEFLADGIRLCDTYAYGFTSKGYPTQVPSEPVTVTLDLGSVWKFNQISLFPRSCYESVTGGTRCFPSDYTISVSRDGKTFETVVTVTDHPDPVFLQQIYHLEETEARYVKLTATKLGIGDFQMNPDVRYRLQLAEIEVAYLSAEPENPPAPEDQTNDATTEPETPTSEPETDTADGTDNGTDGRNGDKRRGCASAVSGGAGTGFLAAVAACLFRKKKKTLPERKK